jgi:hypothetical protein
LVTLRFVRSRAQHPGLAACTLKEQKRALNG